VRLTEEERAVCEATIKKEKGNSETLRRATILLKADADGPSWNDTKISDAEAAGPEAPAVADRAASRLYLAGISGPKGDVLDRYSEPKRMLTRARARVRDNRDSVGQGRLGLGGWLGDAGTRDIGETRRLRRGCPQVVVSNAFTRQMTGGVSVRRAA
jgi:hypothetical protein